MWLAAHRTLAEDKLEFRLGSSLMTTARPSDAVAFSTPLCEYISRSLKPSIPVSLKIGRAYGSKDLEVLGKDISEGRCHVGVILGIEFGWLNRNRPEFGLKPLVIVRAGDLAFDEVMLVADNRKDMKLADLKGKRLARSVRPNLMADFSLDAMLRDRNLEPRGFFPNDSKRYTVPEAARDAVISGEADCMMADANTWLRLRKINKTLADKLAIICHGPELPVAVFVGRPDNLAKIRPNLWNELRKKLVEEVHTSAEGKQLIRFWRIERFCKPDQHFEEMLNLTGLRFDRFYENMEPQSESAP
jgi:hypothetical protein